MLMLLDAVLYNKNAQHVLYNKNFCNNLASNKVVLELKMQLGEI